MTDVISKICEVLCLNRDYYTDLCPLSRYCLDRCPFSRYCVDMCPLSRYYMDMCPLSRYYVDIYPHSNYRVDIFRWFLAVSKINYPDTYGLIYQLLNRQNNLPHIFNFTYNCIVAGNCITV